MSTTSPLPLFHIQYLPFLVLASPPNPIPSITIISATNLKQIESIESPKMRLHCVNDITGYMRTWFYVHSLPPVFLKVTDIFTSPESLAIHTKIFDNDISPPLNTFSNMAHTFPNFLSYHLLECCYIPVNNQPLHSWFIQLLDIITTFSKSQQYELYYVTFWLNKQVLPAALIPAINSLIGNHAVSHTWH